MCSSSEKGVIKIDFGSTPFLCTTAAARVLLEPSTVY